MGTHKIVKTTIEIADDLFERAQRLARRERTTFRALTEQGLRLVLKEKQATTTQWRWTPRTVSGEGINEEFKRAGWDGIRDAIYSGRGG
jgi:predicted transcriptional regulator